MQVSAFLAIFKAGFGRFPTCIGRRPIRPDFGRISPVRCELKSIRHELSRIGVNRVELAQIRGKKKKKKKRRRGPTRGQPRPASDAGAAPLVPCPCFLATDQLPICLDNCLEIQETSVLHLCAS